MRTKICFVIAVLFLVTGDIFSQQLRTLYANDSLRIRQCRVDVISLPHEADVNSPKKILPVTSVLFRDVRFDNSCAGAVNSKANKLTKRFRKIKFMNSVEEELTNVFADTAKYVFQANDIRLLCFVKQLRLTQIDSMSDEDRKKKTLTSIRFEAEGYLELNHRFYPAIRLDTLATLLSTGENNFAVFTDILTLFSTKVAMIDTLKVLKKKAYSLSALNEMYNRRFTRPIIRDTVLNNGVYKTKEEFFNNSPSIKEYQFSKQGILYIKVPDGDWVPTREAYGFCDSGRLWIVADKSFHPLIRQGDTYEFLTVRPVTKTRSTPFPAFHTPASSAMSAGEFTAISSILIAALVLEDSSKSLSNVIHQVNMDTGEFY